MNNYIDLIGRIAERLDVPCGNIRLGIHEALAYLDRNPEQVPGRTITESDYSDIAEWARNYSNRGWEGRTVLAGAGITIVPDRAPGRTITASEFDEAVESCITEDATVPPHKFAERLGVVCIPDPEATNLQRLTQAIRDWEQGRGTDEILARHLDAIGVRVPEADDDRHV